MAKAIFTWNGGFCWKCATHLSGQRSGTGRKGDLLIFWSHFTGEIFEEDWNWKFEPLGSKRSLKKLTNSGCRVKEGRRVKWWLLKGRSVPFIGRRVGPDMRCVSRDQSRPDACQRTQTRGSHSIKVPSPNEKNVVFVTLESYVFVPSESCVSTLNQVGVCNAQSRVSTSSERCIFTLNETRALAK